MLEIIDLSQEIFTGMPVFPGLPEVSVTMHVSHEEWDGIADSGVVGFTHYVGERNRAMLIIPRGVYHAVQNVGGTDAYFINLPTRAYDHDRGGTVIQEDAGAAQQQPRR